MKNCKVIIRSRGDGWTDEIKSLGTVEENNGIFTVNYKINGDDCRMQISSEGAVQTRKGELDVCINFKLRQNTECQINSFGLAGGYQIFTEEIIFNCQKAGLSLTLRYLSGDDREKVKLTLTAIYIK